MIPLPFIPVLRQSRIKFLILLSLSLLCVVYALKDGLFGLPYYWRKAEYSHSYFIPFIAILIGWHRLADVKPLPSPSWHGVWVLLAGFALAIASQLSAFEPLLNYSFVIALAGIVLAFFGKKTAATLSPAFVYLLFAVPLPLLVYVNLSSGMQLLSSTWGVKLLQLLGISVFQDGNVIDLGVMKLQVIEACDGLRYLFPLMSFGFLVAFLLDDKMWKRAFVFLSSVPITIGMNALRIAVIGITVTLWGQSMAEGFLHFFEGWVIFLVCVAFLFGETWILMRLGSRGRFRYEYLGPARGPLLGSAPKVTAACAAGFALCFAFAVFSFAGPFKNRSEIIPPAPNFALFPRTLGPWHGRQGFLEPDIAKLLDFSDYWLADYAKDGAAAPVNFYVAYYESQRIRTSIHSPLNCIPGNGWQIAERAILPVTLPTAALSVNRLVIRKDKETAIVYYWLDQRGRIINTQFDAKRFLIVDALLLRRSDGALVRLTTPVLPVETIDVADLRLRDFLSVAYPAIRNTLPGR